MAMSKSSKDSISVMLKFMWSVDEDKSYNVKIINTIPTNDKNDNHYILIRTFSGAGELLSGKNRFSLEEGSVLLIKKSEINSYNTKEDRWKFFWFEFLLFGGIHPFFIDNLPIFTNEDTLINEIFDSLNNEQYSASCGFSYLISKYIDFKRKSFNEDELMVKIINYCNNIPLNDNILIEDIAKKFSISQRSLHQKFVNKLNISPKRYMLNKKNEAIKILLLTTDMKLYEIASRTGFLSEYYLSKFFKKYNGVSPMDYKKQNKQ